MARPIRVDIEDGVYHVMSRGNDRCDLFKESADYQHFLDRLAEAQKRFGLSIYAYVLMKNHFHLIVATPDANLSRFMQWLKVSYSMWFNAKYKRVGPLFQGRFKGVLVDPDEGWLLELSLYVHLNPVRVKKLGLDKRGKKLESNGWIKPSNEIVKKRVAQLRSFRWSSYPYYAGYKRKVPEWLDLSVVLERVESHSAYRVLARDRISSGLDEGFMNQAQDRLALGAASFVERVRRMVCDDPEYEGCRALKRRFEWDEIVQMVETVRGCCWDEFSGCRGDWARAAVYYLARRHGGLTLREIGDRAGGVKSSAVSKMVKRFEQRVAKDPILKESMKQLEKLSIVQT